MENVNHKEKTVLVLAGIDKRWVRFNGKWVDEATIYVEPVDNEDNQNEMAEEGKTRKKRWWQIFKKKK